MASVYSEYTALGLSFSNVANQSCKDVASTFGVNEGTSRANTEIEQKCPCVLRDVIILSEFSEVQGPVPILTVPIDTTEFGINVDDFILKIMSVDYQASSSGPFRFTTDTQVLQTDVIDGVHAYVHYFSLNDIMARGFVRPMCLSYLTRNRNKLEMKLALLRQSFLQVSDALKEENRVLFLEEVSLGLQQLKEIQHRYFQWKQNLEEVEEGDTAPYDAAIARTNLDQVVDQQNEYNKILQSARSALENIHLCEALSPWKDSFSISKLFVIEQYMAYIKLVVGNPDSIIPNQGRGHTAELRPIVALSPFGVAIGVWYLFQIHKYFESCGLELRGGCFWDQGVEEENMRNDISQIVGGEPPKCMVKKALSHDIYIKLLHHLLPASVCMKYSSHQSENFNATDGEAAVKATNESEAKSRHHSALESMTEALGKSSLNPNNHSERNLKPMTKGSSLHIENSHISDRHFRRPGHVFSDDDSSSDSMEYADAELSENYEFPAEEVWCKCIWTGNMETTLSNPGQTILQFFQMFSKVAQHILYSLLIGRTVVIAGSSNLHPKVWNIISALVYFVPVQKGSRYLRWHRGILVSSHIEKYKVIGLCVPERLTVHDMISPRDKNYVTILDVNSKKILGPAYSGTLLADVHENFNLNFLCAEALVLFLQAVFAGIHQKVLLVKALSLSQPKIRAQFTKDVTLTLGIKGRDLEIIDYLKQFLKM